MSERQWNEDNCYHIYDDVIPRAEKLLVVCLDYDACDEYIKANLKPGKALMYTKGNHESYWKR